MNKHPVDHTFTQNHDVIAILNIITDHPGNVVELGCATGVTTRKIAEIFTGRIIYAVDTPYGVNPQQSVEQPREPDICAMARHLPNVRVIKADAKQWDFAGADNVGVVFIDDDHTYEGVKATTENVLSRLRGPLCLIWHDCYENPPAWVGVRRYLVEEPQPFKVIRFPGTWIAMAEVKAAEASKR